MKVAFLTHEPFYPPSGGGSAEAVYLVRELVQRGHQVHIFCPKLGEPEFVQKEFGVRLHEFTKWPMGRYTSLRSAKYLLYPFFLRPMVEAAHRTVKFDLVLSQHAIAAVAAGWLKRSLQVPVVMNFLDYLTGFMETWPAYLAPPLLLKRLEKFELSVPLRYRADAILTVSDTLADYFAKAGYPRERILPIYYGYDAGLFPFSKGDPAKGHVKAPTIVMHGSLDHHHLGPIALGAIRRVVREEPSVVFRFVGQCTGSLESFLQRIRAEIPAAHGESSGFVPYANVAGHLADASVGIVPYEESTGTHCAFVAKIVEYLAVGLPVVSTPLDSAKRYFGDEPRVRFSVFDGESFGEKILSWLREPAELHLSQARAASERVRAELDWRVISKKSIDFVEGIQLKTGS
ncbi:MAG: glycosyltransferase family 4 protein [Verrucomicrobia bacterium]|nr:glycosyltransferase family 4 protein [Verrucomicrobiota bacterium]